MCRANSTLLIRSRPSLRLVLLDPLDLAHPLLLLLPPDLVNPPDLAILLDQPRQLHLRDLVNPSHLLDLANQ